MSYTLQAIAVELAHAKGKFGPIRSVHEAIGVIREEYLEAEREAFRQHVDKPGLADELVHLAAMCVRAIEDLALWSPDC